MAKLPDNQFVIPLIGSPTDNFYLLGERAKDAIEDFSKQVSGLLLTPVVGEIALNTLSFIAPQSFSDEMSSFIQAFAEGAGLKDTYLKSLALIPEFANSHAKWNAQLTSLIPGCTSIFEYDKQNSQTIHTRVLDYPLLGTFSQHEQSFRLEIPGRQKIFYHTSLVMPFPFFSCMNESGITICLHQKYSKFFNRKGESIFSIMYDVASKATSLKDVKKILKDKISITSWSILCADKNANGLVIDIRGRDHYREEFNLIDLNRPKVINNIPIQIDDKTLNAQPANFINSCLERKKSLEIALQANHTEKNIVKKHMNSLVESHQLNTNTSLFSQTSINNATMQIMSFNPNTMSFSFIKGSAPKFEGQLVINPNVFEQTQFTPDHTFLSKLTNADKTGNHLIAQAQMHLDKNELEATFHFLQMAIATFSGQAYKNIYQFYYLVLCAKYVSGKEELSYVYKDLQTLLQYLPSCIQSHAHLISMRIEKNLKLPVKDRSELIENPQILQRYLKEHKLRASVFPFLMKTTIMRMEIPDLLYQS